jgi:epoxyqueuosine reductase
MEQVVAFIRQAAGPAQEARTLVDTARILDRAAARRAGVGWVGKHTNVITKAAGSWVFLGEILTELELAPDAPLRTNCGTCDLCLRACPTGAIIAPYTVDNNRCISYLTIEHKGIIPRELRPLMGTWVFGCDVCQEVCPYTRAAKAAQDPELRPASVENAYPSLPWLLSMSRAEFGATYFGTPVPRTKRRGLARNAAVALGNIGAEDDIPLLARALRAHDEPLVRGHAAWATGKIGGSAARRVLNEAHRAESDDYVRSEIVAALESCA